MGRLLQTSGPGPERVSQVRDRVWEVAAVAVFSYGLNIVIAKQNPKLMPVYE